jgi:hypothetical protein
MKRVFALALFSASTIAASAQTPMPDPLIEAQCTKYFKTAVCSEALGRWLALPGRRFAAQSRQTTPTTVFDGFQRSPNTEKRGFRADAPTGTFFVHGSAGPPKGTVVYDRTHRIVFSGQGCCSYFETTVASGLPSPPLPVADRDLTGLRTDSGIRIGDSPVTVQRIYGTSTLWSVPMRPDVRLLLYENRHPKQPGPCVQRQSFGFDNGHLAYISFFNGC